MKIVVDKEDIRIDKYLSECTDYSRELVTKMLKEGFITLNNSNVKPSYKVKLEDIIEIDESFIVEQDINPIKMDLNMLMHHVVS